MTARDKAREDARLVFIDHPNITYVSMGVWDDVEQRICEVGFTRNELCYFTDD